MHLKSGGASKSVSLKAGTSAVVSVKFVIAPDVADRCEVAIAVRATL
jgi:hypothetical protein